MAEKEMNVQEQIQCRMRALINILKGFLDDDAHVLTWREYRELLEYEVKMIKSIS